MENRNIVDEELIYNYRQGNGEALELLLFRYEKLLRNTINEYDTFFRNLGYDEEDKKYMLWEILKKAVDKYEFSSGIFYCFLKKILTCEILTLYRSNSFYRNLNRIDFSGKINSDEFFLDDAANVEEKYDFSAIISSIDCLSDKEKKIVMMFAQGYSYKDISKSMKVNQKNVSYIITKVRKYLKDRYK